uniref:Uncharacterized protein n=1 Tax=viral metagenome TaxID=1070528 RepID=A0A6C0AC29_9ZZZZ
MSNISIVKKHYLECEGEEPEYLVKKDNSIDTVSEKNLKNLIKKFEQIGGGNSFKIEEKKNHDYIHLSKIEDISKIYNSCYESYPCSHDCEVVTKDGNIHKTNLNGKEIYSFYKNNDLYIPSHFKIYGNN